MRFQIFLSVVACYSTGLLAQNTDPVPQSNPTQLNQALDNANRNVREAGENARNAVDANTRNTRGSEQQPGYQAAAPNSQVNRDGTQNNNPIVRPGEGTVQGQVNGRTQGYNNGQTRQADANAWNQTQSNVNASSTMLQSSPVNQGYSSNMTGQPQDGRMQYQSGQWQGQQYGNGQNYLGAQNYQQSQFSNNTGSQYASNTSFQDRTYLLQHDAMGREFICLNGHRIYFDQQAPANQNTQGGMNNQNRVTNGRNNEGQLNNAANGANAAAVSPAQTNENLQDNRDSRGDATNRENANTQQNGSPAPLAPENK